MTDQRVWHSEPCHTYKTCVSRMIVVAAAPDMLLRGVGFCSANVCRPPALQTWSPCYLSMKTQRVPLSAYSCVPHPTLHMLALDAHHPFHAKGIFHLEPWQACECVATHCICWTYTAFLYKSTPQHRLSMIDCGFGHSDVMLTKLYSRDIIFISLYNYIFIFI